MSNNKTTLLIVLLSILISVATTVISHYNHKLTNEIIEQNKLLREQNYELYRMNEQLAYALRKELSS